MISRNAKPIESIVIVGGGTAGWLAANRLNVALNRNPGRTCRITLIESSDIGTIGVGEATVPTLLHTFKEIGISESDWMVRCQATFKLAIKFVNWSRRAGSDVFWHPFGHITISGRNIKNQSLFPLAHYWLQRWRQGNVEPFAVDCFENVRICQAGKAPKMYVDSDYAGQASYAYHLDAGLLAIYLKEKAKAEGVRHVVDNVVDIVLDEKGFISHLLTQESGPLPGEFFIDCSGFKGLLINQALNEPFVSYGDSLFCDRAVAMPVPYGTSEKMVNPYTTATALSAGWVWNTPLAHRSGNGYVYSSDFILPDEAEKELRRHLGDSAHGVEARHIKMRVGRTRSAWVNNCVSLGLASGFIEPLESTGIFFIELGLMHLINCFPDRRFDPHLIRTYNQLMRDSYEEVCDFIVMHYCLTYREDTPFWRANKNHTNIPPSLREKLERWKTMWPITHSDRRPIFSYYAYMCIMAGLGYYPKGDLPILDSEPDMDLDCVFAQIRARAAALATSLPGHRDFLDRLRTTGKAAPLVLLR